MINAEIPLLKAELMKQFGYISYQLVLANLDVIGIHILAKGEIIVIAYRGANKVGYFYEFGNMSDEKVFNIFKDVPPDINDLEAYEKSYDGKIEVLKMPKHNYVFINEREAVPLKNKKP